tara:strand:- start:5355 stop:6212 length:858 start_codon:yes stop_codon:yes gene_type:complete
MTVITNEKIDLTKEGNPTLEIEDTSSTAYSGSWLTAPTIDFRHNTANADEHGVLGTLKFKGTTKNDEGIPSYNDDISQIQGISIEGSSGVGQRITDVKGGFRFKGMDGAGGFNNLMSIEGKNLKIESGGGIDFSNSQTHSTSYTPSSEVFDHYEEGNWTPVIKSGGNTLSGFTSGVGSSTARYTRIGNICHIMFSYSSRTTFGSLSGSITVEGLPFAGVGNYNVGSLWMTWDTKINQENVFTAISSGNSLIHVNYQPANSNWAGATFNTLSSGSWGGFSITYYVA